MPNVLEIHNLTISAPDKTKIIDDISLIIPEGATMGIVGESGAGKSLTCLSVLDLLPPSLSIDSGEFIFMGEDISRQRALKRGKNIAYIPQNPTTSLNPIRTVYSQMSETIRYHFPKITEREIRNKCIDLLKTVQLHDTERVLNSYSFELSGGMCQRVLIAMALSTDPQLLIADEPTTALDVVTQAEIMILILDIIRDKNLSMILITHDIPLVVQSCQMITYFEKGIIKHTGFTDEVIDLLYEYVGQ